MGTYMNCYDLVGKVRKLLDEHSDQLKKGRDVTGKYSNDQIVDGINAAQRFIYSMLLKRHPSYFFETADLTGVDSVFTLPWDFGQLLYFKDENGRQIFPIQEKNRHIGASAGYDRLYTQRNNTLVLDKSGVTDAYALFYYRKPRDLNYGKAGSNSGALSIELASSAKGLADYYNGMIVEDATQGWVDTITDYTAVRVATILQTAAENDYYGIVSDLPEMFHHLIIPRAVMSITGLYPGAKEKPSSSGSTLFNDEFRAAFSAFKDLGLDREPSSIFDDWNPTGGVPVGIILGD